MQMMMIIMMSLMIQLLPAMGNALSGERADATHRQQAAHQRRAPCGLGLRTGDAVFQGSTHRIADRYVERVGSDYHHAWFIEMDAYDGIRICSD